MIEIFLTKFSIPVFIMVEISPFRAFHYDLTKVSRLSEVVAPPYDIINPEQEQSLKVNPRNITHLDLPASYEHASSLLEEWIRTGFLIQSRSESIYVYEMTFHKYGKQLKIQGLIALVKLVDFSEKHVFPHEMTFSKCMDDRLNLLQKTNANFCPIYMIYQSNSTLRQIISSAIQSTPVLSTNDHDGFTHSVWEISSPSDINTISNFFETKHLIIADGHHRYKTGLIHSKQLNGLKHVMTFLVDFENPGLLILPPHRLIKSFSGIKIDAFLERISKLFLVEKCESEEDLISELKVKENIHSYGLFYGPTNSFYAISLRENVEPSQYIENEHSDDWKKLDVSVLHEIILDDKLNSHDNIAYEKSRKKGLDVVRQGECEALFILNPLKLEEIQKITEAGELMPHKSTYFHPKPLSGILIYKK